VDSVEGAVVSENATMTFETDAVLQGCIGLRWGSRLNCIFVRISFVFRSHIVHTRVFPLSGSSIHRCRVGTIGVLTEDDRVELLEGWIVPKMNHNPAHDGTIDLVEDALRGHLPDGWRIRIQSAITTVDSEPEPDLAIVRGPANRYVEAHPCSPDIGLVIEVADTSLSRDHKKCRLYAREGIIEYWIVDLVNRRIERYSNPSGVDADPAYRSCDTFDLEREIPLVIDGTTITALPVRLLLPAN